MSVINDVLSDLHNRQRQQRLSECISFVYDEKYESTSSRTYHKVILLFITSIVILFTIKHYDDQILFVNKDNPTSKIQNQSNINSSFMEKYGAIDFHILSSLPKSIIENDVSFSVTDPVLSNNVLVNDHEDTDIIEYDRSQFTGNQKNEVEDLIKIESLDAELIESEMAIIEIKKETEVIESNSLNSSKINQKPLSQAQVSRQNTEINKSKKSFEDEQSIKHWMLNQPEKVWPYIQRTFPNAYQKVNLLALGAQGEQRSGQHKQAISLYQRLLQLEPKEAKWYAGLAISLDASGQYEQAQAVYRQSLILNPLPLALNQFVQNRLLQLVKGSHYE